MSLRDWTGIGVVWLVSWLTDKPLPSVFEWSYRSSEGEEKLANGRVIRRRLVLLSALALLAIVGCGGASPEVRSAYTAEVARCEAAEDEILTREGATEAEDLAALAVVHESCEASLAQIRGR